MNYPLKGQHPCFGKRQGWCDNQAVWRMETDRLILHFCDECKGRENVKGLTKDGGAFIEMPEFQPEET